MAFIEQQTNCWRGAISNFTYIIVVWMNLLFPDLIYKYCYVENLTAQINCNAFSLFRVCSYCCLLSTSEKICEIIGDICIVLSSIQLENIGLWWNLSKGFHRKVSEVPFFEYTYTPACISKLLVANSFLEHSLEIYDHNMVELFRNWLGLTASQIYLI